MRVISGKFKSRRLFFPKTFLTRPVTDRAKETIFNVLGSLCQDANVLDLFSGSGSLGIEALSRGANTVYFVESARIATSCIKKNLEVIEMESVGTILETPVELAIKKFQKMEKKFNLIFLDPPHNKGLIKNTLRQLDASDIVNLFGTIVIGHSNHESLPEDLKTLCHQRSIKIGQTFVSFLTKKEPL